MIRQFLIIFGCLAVGEIIVWLTGISIPSSKQVYASVGLILNGVLTAMLTPFVLKFLEI